MSAPIELVYIGSEYRRGLVFDDGSAFASVPAVALYNVAYKKYHLAEVTMREGAVGCEFLFSAAETAKMIPGAYALEIYEDDTLSNMLKRIEFYANAIEVTASQKEHNKSEE